MAISGSVLYAFADLKDPYLLTGLEGEEAPGPVLSILGWKEFDGLYLFHLPQTLENARKTQAAAAERHPECVVELAPLAVSDPKDYSGLMGTLGQAVRKIARSMLATDNYICVSSGTAEMRAAWFLLSASGVLKGKLVQVGTPAQPLFGAANVREVDLLGGEWDSLRDLVMPQRYARKLPPLARVRDEATRAPQFLAELPAMAIAEEPEPELEDALRELGLFAGSALIRQEAERAAVAAGVDAPVLITGETGTGKDLFARLVHRMSARSVGEFVAVNCATLKELAESRLFGHVKGSFTGAVANARGYFDQANGGTLFLDEIGELPLEAQAKLLRVVQDSEVQPLGSEKRHTVNVRLIAATNRDLGAEVKAGRFREDLFYRIEVVHLKLPPLRMRRSEIPQLAMAILGRLNARRAKETRISKEALRRLEEYEWPGNVRQLENVLERSLIYARTEVLGADDLIISGPMDGGQHDPLAALPEPVEGFSLEGFLSQARKQLILRALAKSGGNQSQAAALLGISKQAVNKFVQDNPD